MPSPNHVSVLPTGYRFAMASVIDDAKQRGQDAKYVSPPIQLKDQFLAVEDNANHRLKAEQYAHDAKLKAENVAHDVKLKAQSLDTKRRKSQFGWGY